MKARSPLTPQLVPNPNPDMFAAFSILLLFIFALIFWTFRQSKHVWLRTFIISIFFGFCVVFGLSIDSIMGWSAKAKYLPEVVTLLHVNIREPNPESGDPGNIYLLIRHAPTADNLFLKTFGYSAKIPEPRLFRVPYSREMHKSLQENVMPQLAKGQSVTGSLSKGGKGKGKGGKGKGGKGDGDGDGDGDGQGEGRGGKGERGGRGDGQGDGSDSLEVPWVFHVLPPSAFLHKDPQ